jgi:hypothetical protein
VAGTVDLDTGQEPIPRWQSRLAAFAELRDTILFGFSALYVLGYVTWAIYSADRGLGVLPPLEGQYFLAGVVPLLILGAAYGLLRVLRPASTVSQRERALKWGEWAMRIAMFAIVAAAASRQIGAADINVFFVVGTISMYASAILRVRSGEDGTRWMRWLFVITVPCVVVAAGLVYATRIFPLLPAEFGGPQPVCVALDISTASVSVDTAAAVGIATGTASTATRSASVWLHFDGGGLLVVSRKQGRPIPGVIRLQESVVTASTPASGCETVTPAPQGPTVLNAPASTRGVKLPSA